MYLRFEGRIRPDQVSLFEVRYPVDPWYAPIKICYQCFMFGHVSLQCKSQPKCINCGNKKHTDGEVCPRKDGPPRCRNYKSEHLPTDKMCPAFLHKKAINALAAERNISLIEAIAIFPNSSTAASSATPSPSPTPSDQSFHSLSYFPLPPPSPTPTPIPYSQVASNQLSYAKKIHQSPSAAATLLDTRPIASPFPPQYSPRQQSRNETVPSSSIFALRAAHTNMLLAPNGRYPSIPYTNFHPIPPPLRILCPSSLILPHPLLRIQLKR